MMIKPHITITLQKNEFNIYITEQSRVAWLKKLKVPPNIITFRLSRNEPAKKLKLFHVWEVLISDSSLTTVLTFPCMSCFVRGVEALLAAKALLKHGKLSSDILPIADKMYLMQEAQYSEGSYIGVNEEGDHHRGVVAFMIYGLKETVPILIRLSPETTINGQ